MIEVAVTSKRFNGNAVLGDVHFTVRAGEVVVILGPSGIGKSTLLRIVAGTDPAFDGAVTRQGRLAMVFQEPTLLPWRTVGQNLTLVHPELDRAGVVAALAQVGIPDKADAFPLQLSLGQQRRVALARAFAVAPEILILDEPFASLDPTTAEEMLALTERLIAATRPATLFVTHSEAEAARLGTRTLRLAGHPATLAGDLT
jgi:NitT/TauT family transport system ATP-binding protein